MKISDKSKELTGGIFLSEFPGPGNLWFLTGFFMCIGNLKWIFQKMALEILLFRILSNSIS